MWKCIVCGIKNPEDLEQCSNCITGKATTLNYVPIKAKSVSFSSASCSSISNGVKTQMSSSSVSYGNGIQQCGFTQNKYSITNDSNALDGIVGDVNSINVNKSTISDNFYNNIENGKLTVDFLKIKNSNNVKIDYLRKCLQKDIFKSLIIDGVII